MKRTHLILLLLVIVFTSCSKDDEILEQSLTPTDSNVDESIASNELEVEKFVWNGMNDIYLYKADVPQLGDTYFSGDTGKIDFLEGFNSPEELFAGLKSGRDRFSFITANYKELEDSFRGISSSTAGMQFGLGRISGSDYIFGFLEYVIPGTSAAEAGLTRGTLFTEVNGQKMTLNNFQDLMDADSFTIKLAKLEGSTLSPTEETVTLHQDSYTSNPVHVVNTLNVEGRKVGYLMYNSFIADFDDELNEAFALLKSEGITDLVLDLRYNGGGSVESAIDLASMITGQFNGEIFMKEQWNEKYQSHYEVSRPESLVNRFNDKIRTGEGINSLNLSKVYILTTGSSASASELVINGLAPYIDVIQVGDKTTGKFQASVTLYDSDNFGREGASENHTYAIQPLVFKSANADGKSDYENGLIPDVDYTETVTDLGVLGDPSEPLLSAALNHIAGKAPAVQKRAGVNIEKVGQGNMHQPTYQRMYLDEVPELLQ